VPKSVAEKTHIKPGTRIAVLDGPAAVIESLGLPADIVFTTPEDADLIFLFVKDRAQLEADMPTAVDALGPGAALWVFFRKGGRAAGLDMSRDDVWSLAERRGMRPLGLVSVDDTWSAFRLRAAR
jgi:hypothetical protein